MIQVIFFGGHLGFGKFLGIVENHRCPSLWLEWWGGIGEIIGNGELLGDAVASNGALGS